MKRSTPALPAITADLVSSLKVLRFGPPVAFVYNPLVYAAKPYARYLERFGQAPREILFMGMNPGPWGMAQTGIPFGEVSSVRDWLKLMEDVESPRRFHPKRPVTGFTSRRSEVSGKRLWGWARTRFSTPEAFFRRFFVANYCPLLFLEESGRNLTPDKLPATDREPLLAACDLAFRRTVEYFRPRHVLGVGHFAASRARAALAGLDVAIGSISHPSPASPKANQGWERLIEAELADQGIHL